MGRATQPVVMQSQRMENAPRSFVTELTRSISWDITCRVRLRAAVTSTEDPELLHTAEEISYGDDHRQRYSSHTYAFFFSVAEALAVLLMTLARACCRRSPLARWRYAIRLYQRKTAALEPHPRAPQHSSKAELPCGWSWCTPAAEHGAA